MKNLGTLIQGSLLVGALLVANQSVAATATANATATVITPISISTTTDLAFGRLSVGATGGTLAVDTAGATGVTGDVLAVPGIAPTAAAFAITGEADATYAVTLPSSILLSDGANDMLVDNFTSASANGETLTGGSDTLSVGATLNVGSNQAPGSYSGTFDVTVDYN